MKTKIFTLCVAGAALANNGCAQDTLFAWNLFHANDIITYGHAEQTLAPNVNPGNNGLGQTWIFSTTAFEYLDTLNVVEMNDVPPQYSNEFPQSNLALYYGNDQTYFDFVHTNGTALILDGTASLDQNFGVMVQEYQDPLEYLRWPMMYNVNFIDTAFDDRKYPTAGPSDSAWEITTIEMEVQVDAQGTLITSFGTYDIIRVRRDFTYWQQFATHDPNTGWTSFSPLNFTSRVYEFWTDSIHIGWMVASLLVNPANDAVLSYMIQTDYIIGTDEIVPLAEFMLYPNPAQDIIYISGETGSQWNIMDVYGRQMKSGILRNKTEEIRIAELAAGTYILQIVNAQGSAGSRKFVRN